MATKPTIKTFPVLALLAGAAMWGVVWYPMRLLEATGLSGLWLTFGLYATAFAASLPVVAKQLYWMSRYPWITAGLLFSGGWTNTAFVLAILDGNIMRVLLLFYLSPVWAVLLGWLFLKERLTQISLVTLAVALAGAILMLWEPGSGLPWPHGPTDWLALSSGFAFAVSIVMVRKGAHIPVVVKAFTTWLGVVVLSVGLIVFTKQPVPTVGPGTVGGVVALALFGIVVMTLLVQYGISHMFIQRSAIILLFELVAGAISQQLLTDEILLPREWLGGLLVVAAGVLAAQRHRKETAGDG